MAGNNRLQFLRGTSTKREGNDGVLNPGQPFYEVDTNTLYIGGKDGSKLSEATPVFASALPHEHDTYALREHEHDYAPSDLIQYSTTDIGTDAYLPTGHLYVVYEE